MDWWNKIQKGCLWLLSILTNPPWINRIAVLAFVLTLIGVTLSIRSMRESSFDMDTTRIKIDTTRIKIDTAIVAINKVSESVNTRYIGSFPNCMVNINKLLEEAVKGSHIVIFQDFITYGMLSSPEEFHKMMSILIHKRQKDNDRIDIIIYNDTLYQKTMKAQLLGTKYFEQYKSKYDSIKRYKNKIDDDSLKKLYDYYTEEIFQKSINDPTSPLPAKYHNFMIHPFDTIDEYHEPLKKIVELRKECGESLTTYKQISELLYNISKFLIERYEEYGINITRVPSRHIMNCWCIEDAINRKAIFSFPSRDDSDEIAFITLDSNIFGFIDTLYAKRSSIINNDDIDQ